MNFGSNDCFMAGVALMDGHYKMDIISSVGHLKLDLVVSLMFCTVVYNILGIIIVLQVLWDSANPARNGQYLE
jgi:hypothetical protein